MKTTGKIVTFAVALSTLGFAAQAQEAPAPGHAPKEITRAEALSQAAERFDRADLDGDGILTIEEMREGVRHMREKMDERRGPGGPGMDGPNGKRGDDHADRDGRPERGDRPERGERGNPFEHIDANSDGSVSFEEFLTSAQKMAERHHDASPERTERFAKAAFDRMDADKSGALSEGEMDAGMKRMKDRRGDRPERGDFPGKPGEMPPAPPAE